MKVVIVGQKWLGAEVMKSLAENGREIVAVSPEQKPDRLCDLVESMGLPMVGLEDIPACDLIVAAHCHRFIPASVRGRAGMGVLAYHPSLLPRHRGRDAVHWTIAMGDPVAGGTVYWMDDAADAGPIERQDWCFVQPGDTPASLWRRELGPMGVRLIAGVVGDLSAGGVPLRRSQEDLEFAATFEPGLVRGRLGGGVG